MRFCREYAHFVPFITQILLRQMLFDSDFTQIYVQKNGEWSLCSGAELFLGYVQKYSFLAVQNSSIGDLVTH